VQLGVKAQPSLTVTAPFARFRAPAGSMPEPRCSFGDREWVSSVKPVFTTTCSTEILQTSSTSAMLNSLTICSASWRSKFKLRVSPRTAGCEHRISRAQLAAVGARRAAYRNLGRNPA